MSKFMDWIRGTAAEAESVANQDLELVSREWPKFVTNWQAASTRKKVLNILVPLMFVGGLWYFGGTIGQIVLEHTIGVRNYVRGDVVSHKDLEAALSKFKREQALSAPLTVSPSDLDGIKAAIADMQRKVEAAPSALEFKDAQNDIAELQAAVKALEQRRPPRKLATGSTRKSKPLDLTDPSTWKISQ